VQVAIRPGVANSQVRVPLPLAQRRDPTPLIHRRAGDLLALSPTSPLLLTHVEQFSRSGDGMSGSYPDDPSEQQHRRSMMVGRLTAATP